MEPSVAITVYRRTLPTHYLAMSLLKTVQWYALLFHPVYLFTLAVQLQMEPLSVAIHSVSNLGQFRTTQSIVIFGCGPVGLLCMAVAKALGASRIIAVDIIPGRLEFAKKYAATEVYLPPKPEDGESKVDYSRRNAENMKTELDIADRGDKSIDLVLDASGAEVSIQTAIYVAKAGGTVVQVAVFFYVHGSYVCASGRYGEPKCCN